MSNEIRESPLVKRILEQGIPAIGEQKVEAMLDNLCEVIVRNGMEQHSPHMWKTPGGLMSPGVNLNRENINYMGTWSRLKWPLVLPDYIVALGTGEPLCHYYWKWHNRQIFPSSYS